MGATPTATSHGPGATPLEPVRADVVLLCCAVLSGSAAGPLGASVVVASGLTITLWRLVAGTIFGLPLGIARARRDIPRAGRRPVWGSIGAGVLLAAHFVSFMTSLQLTSVASATALINSQIVWAAVITRLLGNHVSRRVWWGVGLAVLGVGAITGVDFALSPAAIGGDLLALAGGVLGGGFIVTGGKVRRHLSSPTYTMLCYSTGVVVMLPVCLLTGQQLVGLPRHDWVALGGLILFAQLIGQNLFSQVLRSIPPTLVSLGMLFTAPLSAGLAWIFLGQVPPVSAAAGLIVLIVGAGLVISGSIRGPATSTAGQSADRAGQAAEPTT